MRRRLGVGALILHFALHELEPIQGPPHTIAVRRYLTMQEVPAIQCRTCTFHLPDHHHCCACKSAVRACGRHFQSLLFFPSPSIPIAPSSP